MKAEPGMPGHIVDAINSALGKAFETRSEEGNIGETTVEQRIHAEVLSVVKKYHAELAEKVRRILRNQIPPSYERAAR